jgi:heme-degrading monooxygenase HmoA
VAQLYTSAERLVLPGREDEFVRIWRELARWTLDEMEGNGRALLMRDRWNLRRFVSLGEWESLEAIERWRAEPGFQMRNAQMQALTESYAPSTLEEVASLDRRH